VDGLVVDCVTRDVRRPYSPWALRRGTARQTRASKLRWIRGDLLLVQPTAKNPRNRPLGSFIRRKVCRPRVLTGHARLRKSNPDAKALPTGCAGGGRLFAPRPGWAPPTPENYDGAPMPGVRIMFMVNGATVGGISSPRHRVDMRAPTPIPTVKNP
jgi:hypothetical protein